MPRDQRETGTDSNSPRRHGLRTWLVLMLLVTAMVALLFILRWGWSEYEGFVKRQKLTPIPVPAPP